MQRLPDDLVRDVRAVKIARVDVVHAQCDGVAQYVDGRVHVPGWTEDMRPRQLHGAIAHAVEANRSVGQRKGLMLSHDRLRGYSDDKM
jgi:hypothetical protein